MIPRTFPTTVEPETGNREMVVYYLSDITGLSRWVDYIPVRTVQNEISEEDNTNANGFQAVSALSSISGKVAFIDYVPVYEDGSATVPFSTNADGYIPVGISGGGSATLFLNFAYSKALDSRITFTRADATTCATYFDSTGVLRTAAANIPRFDHDPATGVCKGLLIEESRANLLKSSRDLRSNASGNPVVGWVNTDTTVTVNQTGVDGVVNSASLVTEGSAGTALVRQDATVSVGATLTVSLCIKRSNTDWVRVIVGDATLGDRINAWFNLSSGVLGSVTATGVGSLGAATITPIGNGFYRCTVTSKPNGIYTGAAFQINSATADLSGTRVANATYIVDYSQLEVGAFATSPIPTTTAAVTRAADVASMTGTNFSSWFNESEGTWVTSQTFSYVPSVSQFPGVFGCGAGSNAESHQLYFTNTNQVSYEVRDGAVQQGVLTRTDALPQKIAATYKVNDLAMSVDGGTLSTDTSATIPTPDRINFGANAGGAVNLNGWLSKFVYYPKRLSNATLQALTR